MAYQPTHVAKPSFSHSSDHQSMVTLVLSALVDHEDDRPTQIAKPLMRKLVSHYVSHPIAVALV